MDKRSEWVCLIYYFLADSGMLSWPVALFSVTNGPILPLSKLILIDGFDSCFLYNINDVCSPCHLITALPENVAHWQADCTSLAGSIRCIYLYAYSLGCPSVVCNLSGLRMCPSKSGYS